MADGGGPPEQCRSEGMPSHSEAPNGGAKALGYLGLFQVTRCKSETASSRYRRNGYIPPSQNQSSFSPQTPGKKKPAIMLAWIFLRDKSGSVCGHFGIMRNQRNQGVLLAMGELAEALQQLTFVQ